MVKNKIYCMAVFCVEKIRPVYIKPHAKRILNHYADVIGMKQEAKRSTVRFGAYVVFDSVFGINICFEKMIEENDYWEPRIVVIPDLSRGIEHQKRVYCKTKDFFIAKYGAKYVLDGWDLNDNYYDYSDKFDIIYYANPYDKMVHKFHRIEYAASKNVLPVYISYGYDVTSFMYRRLKSPAINYLWKCFTDTEYSFYDYQKYQLIKGKNVVVTGYSKMDEFAKLSGTNSSNERLKILIAPHHTVLFQSLPLSCFLEYNELLLELPKLFKDIDFIIRPHPLLFTNMVNKNIWTENEVIEYIAKLKEVGYEYSEGGDYYELFNSADAIILDCASFLVEWLFTGKPGCFVWNKDLSDKHFSSLGKKALEEYSIAFDKRDILEFITNLQKQEIRTHRMKDWVKDKIAINYPNASDRIIDELRIL